MIQDDQGNYINPAAWPQSYTYDGSGNLETISFTDGTFTWTKTFTYSAGNMTGESGWVRS